MSISRLLFVALVLALALGPPAPAAAQGEGFFECADFTPVSVRDACDRAVPIECRGPGAPSDFEQCLREQGTTPEAVRAAIEAAQRAAGIPVGGVDTGLGGLAVEEARAPAPVLLVAALVVLAALAVARRHARRT